MKKLFKFAKKYKYLVVVLSVLHFLLTPVHISLFKSLTTEVIVINYSIVILAIIIAVFVAKYNNVKS